MGYVAKTIIGLALFLGAIVLFNVKLLALLETGTCAAGNTPYEIAQPCPEGTGTDILLLVGSIFAGLIGAVIFAVRGDPPGGKGSIHTPLGGFSYGMFAWGLFFAATGAVCLIAAITDEDLSPGSELAGYIVGITFLLMGLPAVGLALWGLVKSLRNRERLQPG